MATTQKQTTLQSRVLLWALVLAVAVVAGCKKKEEPQPASGGQPGTSAPSTDGTGLQESLQAVGNMISKPTASLQQIVQNASSWTPSFEQWWGKPAPDFTLKDVDGNLHRLSDYKGKDVIVTFGTTWCPTCKLQVPHIKQLKETLGDKLAALSVSSEPATLLKEYAAQKEINYTMLSRSAPMQQPYSLVQYIPSTFFIDPEGVIKVAATGLVPAAQGKAIVEAR